MSFTDDFLKGLEKRNVKQSWTKESNEHSQYNDYTRDFLTSLEKRKNKKEEEEETSLVEDIAPVRSDRGKADLLGLDLVQKGTFDDGYQFGDVSKAILGTAGDLGLEVLKGVGGLAEGIVDTGAYLIAGGAELFGADDVARGLRKTASKSQLEQLTGGADDFLEKYSVAGNTLDAVGQGVGQVGTLIATGGLASTGLGATMLTTGLMGVSGVGSGMSEAYEGGASDDEALTYGIISGAADAFTEMIFGGLGKSVNALGFGRGLSSADDMLAKAVSSKFKRTVAKNVAEFGIKAGAEGLEEVLAGTLQAIGKKATYMSEEDFDKILADENLFEQFVVGAMTSGIAQAGSVRTSIKTGRDFITGLTQNEQTVVDSLYESEIADKDLDKKEKQKIYDQILTKLDKGYIGIEDIERTLGGETYKAYKETSDSENALKGKLTASQKEYNELKDIHFKNRTEAQNNRLAELETEIKNLEAQVAETTANSKLGEMKSQLSKSVFELTKSDTKLQESYREEMRRGQDLELDVEQYKGAAKITAQNLLKGGMNNTNRVHDVADLLTKISADKNIVFDVATAKKLADAGLAVDGKQVNGVITKDGIVLNLESPAVLETTVGHEITHALEGTEHYEVLKSVIKEYAELKGVYADKYSSLESIYAKKDAQGNILKDANGNTVWIRDDVDIDSEIVADLVGEYLFTDADFINNLSVKHRNVFQKVYDEIKYLLKIATAGSEEARKLEEVKRAFDKAYKENKASAVTGTKLSLSSIANTFFGDENMSSNEFMKKDYRETEGYRNYVDQCLNNYKQSRTDFVEREAEYRKEIEDSIAGIVRVAVAAKQAGYDIFDDATKRDKKDSKKRLLFSSLEPNSDYFTSSDISTICDKRKNFAEIYDDIVRAEEAKGVPAGKRFFDNVDNYFAIHKIMAEKGLTTPCRQCYVESMRKNLAPMANAFLRLVRETNPDNKANDQLYHQSGKNKGEQKTSNASTREWVLTALAEYDMSVSDLTVETLTTADGLAQLKIQAPMVYEAFNSFYGQSKPKMPKGATPFRFGELTALLTDEKGKIKQSLVNKINSTGGFRLQSYSDFQIQNYTDVLQVIFEAGTLGLNGHAYTKVPAFLDATEGTNLKRNISIFMYKDGGEWKLDRNDSFPYTLEEIYDIVDSDETGNTSIIAVSQNDDMSAWIMANDNVGYGIPFHKSGLKMNTVRDTDVKTEDGRIVKGYSGTKDHTKQQTEVWAKTTADHKAETKVKNGINIYSFWDFANKGNLPKKKLIEKNVKAYIDACNDAGYLPKFRDYVRNNGKVLENVLKYAKEMGFVSQDATISDISFEYSGYTIPYGYYKFLGDFGMFTPDGKASPQKALSLNDYDFDKAVDFFADAETLRRNEVLQQFANGTEREKYRQSDLKAEELLEIAKQKRKEVVDSVVKYSLTDSDGNQLSPAVQNRFAKSKVVDDNGNLKVVYHGTASGEFFVFDKAKGSVEGDFGSGFYFTDNEHDVSRNYEGGGPDFENKIDRRAEQIEAEEDISYGAARKRAIAELYKGSHKFEVYLNIENPAIVGETTLFDPDTYFGQYNEEDYDSYEDYEGDVEQLIADDIDQILWDVERNVDVYSTDGLAEVVWNAVNEGGIGIEDLKKQINELYLEDSNGNLVGNEVTRQIIESLGYDGIIDPTVSGKWNMDMEEGTTHYIVFKPNQIKSISNENPTDNPDIRYSLSDPNDIAPVDFQRSAKYLMVEKTTAQDFGDVAPTQKHTDAPVATDDEEIKAETLVDRDSFVVRRAKELYEEITNLKKGVRASKSLGYLLDHGHEWRSIKTALLNIRDNPNQVVNENSAAESVAREMLGREYDEMVYELNEQTDVAGSIRTKMKSIQTEIDNNEKLREQANADYDAEIAEVQAKYDAKKNKNTIEANNLLRRIERLHRMKNTNDANYAKRIGDLEARLEKMSQPTYKTAVQRRKKQSEYTTLMESLVGDTSTWVDKKLGISYKVNTLRRNLRDIVRDASGKQDIAKADAIYDELQGNYNRHEAELKRESKRLKQVFADMKLTSAEDTYAHMLGEFRHNPDSKLTEEAVKEYYEQHKKDIDTAKVDKAIEEARKTFDELIARVNERLREQGMKEIPYRQGYFPHFTNPKQGFLAKLFNWKPVDHEIPTSIAGITETFNPERSWQSFNKQRKSDLTDYSLAQGLDTYIHGSLDWIYHIEDIQKRRALENHIRYTHSEEGVKARIDAIRNNEELDADEMQDQIDLVYAEANNPLNNFVTDLRAGTNTLAAKKSSMDRAMEEKTNRKIYSVMTNLNNRVSANMVVGSISSAMTNFIPIVQSWVEVSPMYSLRGIGDTIRSTARDDGIINKSTFLTNRLIEEEKLYKTGWDKASDKAAFLMNAVDSFTSQTVWRSKYLQNISEGMSETEAIHNADQFAENVIAGRSRGNMPTIFDAKNPITKIFTAFQLEVANQYGYMFKDAPTDSKNKARLVKGFATMFIGSYLYNALYSSLVGRNAAFDPLSIIEDLLGDLEDEEEEEAIVNLANNVIEEIPFVGGLLGGGRIPISSALPYSGEYEGFSKLVTDISEENWENVFNEMLSPLYYLIMPFGGGQIKKTNEGLGMFSEDHPIAGSYTASGNLRFPVEDNFINRMQAALFGQYASENARDYFDNNRTALKEKQIQEFIDVDIPIRDYWEYREGLSEQKTIEDKFDYIAGLDLPVAKKNILINNIVDREESVDLEGYEDFSNYEEFDFATKNPEKYTVAKAVGGFNSYTAHYKAMNDISADKDENGKSIVGSRKEKIIDYVNSLDIDYGMKIILFKSEYKADDTYNADILDYLNSRDDLTYEEIVTILTELDFTVDANGNVYWD